jgi:hypothetical protein
MLVGVEVMDVPKNPAYDVWIPNQDFMTWTPDVVFDIIIGNPPYSITRNGKRHTIVNEWIKHSFELLSSEGWIYYVLREGFDNNVRAWKTILSKHPPVEEHMLLPRPNFFGPHDKRTDGSSGARWNYSWVSFNS